MLDTIEQGTGPSVLLIHGAGPDGEQWRAVIDDLSADHRVVAYNRRGYPGSGEPAADWGTHIDDAIEVIEGRDLSPATVVGHSAGTVVAAGVAVRRPELCGRLVMFDPILHAQKRPTLKLIVTFVSVQRQRKSDPEAAAETFFRWATAAKDGSGSTFDRMSAEDQAEMRSRHRAVFADTDAGDGSEQIQTADIKALRNTTIGLGELSDPWFSKNARALARRLPDARLEVIEGSAHAVMLDNPGRVAEIIRSA